MGKVKYEELDMARKVFEKQVKNTMNNGDPIEPIAEALTQARHEGEMKASEEYSLKFKELKSNGEKLFAEYEKSLTQAKLEVLESEEVKHLLESTEALANTKSSLPRTSALAKLYVKDFQSLKSRLRGDK